MEKNNEKLPAFDGKDSYPCLEKEVLMVVVRDVAKLVKNILDLRNRG